MIETERLAKRRKRLCVEFPEPVPAIRLLVVMRRPKPNIQNAVKTGYAVRAAERERQLSAEAAIRIAPEPKSPDIRFFDDRLSFGADWSIWAAANG